MGLCEPVPVGGGAGAGGGDGLKETEELMVKRLMKQHSSEQSYINEAFALPRLHVIMYIAYTTNLHVHYFI